MRYKIRYKYNDRGIKICIHSHRAYKKYETFKYNICCVDFL